MKLFILLIFFSLFNCQSDKQAQLKEDIASGAHLIDVRSPAEFAMGSVPNAQNIPLDQIPQQVSKWDKNKKYVLFCRSGNRSGQAVSIMQQAGFNHVVNGGSWQNVNELVTEINKK